MSDPLSVAAALHGENTVKSSLDFSMHLTRVLPGRNLSSSDLLPVGSTVMHLTNPDRKDESLFIFLERPVGHEITEQWSPGFPPADTEAGVLGRVTGATYRPGRDTAELVISLKAPDDTYYELTYRSAPIVADAGGLDKLLPPRRAPEDCLDNLEPVETPGIKSPAAQPLPFIRRSLSFAG